MDDEVFLAQLNKYPSLRRRMEEILNVAGDLTESLNLADDAEGALIENSRHLNREALQAWASNKAMQTEAQFEKKHKKAHKDIKKNFVGTVHLEILK